MSREAELAVLAACIQSPVARTEAKRRITGSDFDSPQHEQIWNAITQLERHGKEVGWITVNHLLANQPHVAAILPELVTMPALPEQVADYADIVRDQAMLRRLDTEITSAQQHVRKARDAGGASGKGLAVKIANRFAAIRDGGLSTGDISALTLDELMATPDEPYDWIIEDLLERSDRLVLTGEEGLGKSHLLRQISVLAAAGLHPFTNYRMKPCKTVIFDCENTQRQVKRSIRDVFDFARRNGQDPGSRVVIECMGRVDLTVDKDLARIHHLLDATLPDIVVIGPMYRLIPRAIQTDDEAAPLLAALDSIRDRGIAILIEAHAGHSIGRSNQRDLRPRGSSALLGWPEFGYGMRADGPDWCELTAWRGDRDSRQWPVRLQRTRDGRWMPTAPVYAMEGM